MAAIASLPPTFLLLHEIDILAHELMVERSMLIRVVFQICVVDKRYFVHLAAFELTVDVPH